MKVLMIEYFYPENTYTQELGAELKKHADVTILCKKKVPLPNDGLTWKGLLYEGYHSRVSAPFLYAASLLQIGFEIWKGHYDVVNIQYMRAPKYEIRLFRLLKNRYGILANTIHTLVPHEAAPEDKELHRKIYAGCDLLIVHNQECRAQLIRDYGVDEKKICLMPHGVYSVKPDTVQLRDPQGKTRFLMFGQLRKYKGVDILLEAVSKIPKEFRERIRVTIAGPQYQKLDDTDYAAMCKDLGVEDCVTMLTRHIPVEEHEELFAKTDICVFPYKELYGSGSLIMAYSFEKPVIVSEDPIFEEETDEGRTGLIFEKNDPQSLADNMVSTLSWTQDDYETRRTHIRWMNENKFSWKKSARILFGAYESALKDKRKNKKHE